LTYEGEPCAFVAITDISARKDVEKSLRHLAETDPLTGLWNRRKFFELLQIEQARVHRYHRPGTVLSLDIDHFKAVNDRHGHAVGDAMLVHFAHLIRQQLRLVDIVGRIGGEEFAVILPETDHQAAWQVAEKLRATVEATPLVLESGQKIPVTVSLGLAVLEGASNTDTVMLAADQALYRAKSQGRNAIAV
jgi:diguanylate cyclase (GGDEF)-like protein